MSLGYQLAYRFGVTPWEEAGRIFGGQIDTLLDSVVSRPGRALDVGCGTGDHSIELAKRGWRVTGVDTVQLALNKADAKARDCNVDVSFVHGDATELGESVGGNYDLVLDVGCFHGLTDAQRVAYASQITAIAAPGATLLMFAFGRGHRGPLPRGVSRCEAERTFTGWNLNLDVDADTTGMPGPLKKADPRWFRFVRT